MLLCCHKKQENRALEIINADSFLLFMSINGVPFTLSLSTGLCLYPPPENILHQNIICGKYHPAPLSVNTLLLKIPFREKYLPGKYPQRLVGFLSLLLKKGLEFLISGQTSFLRSYYDHEAEVGIGKGQSPLIQNKFC